VTENVTTSAPAGRDAPRRRTNSPRASCDDGRFAQIDPVFAAGLAARSDERTLKWSATATPPRSPRNRIGRLGRTTPVCGYWFGAITRDTPRNRSFAVLCNAGATLKSAFPNHVNSRLPLWPILNRMRMSSAIGLSSRLLAIVDAWEPSEPAPIPATDPAQRTRLLFPATWIQYLCPWLAEKIAPPPTVLSERLPNGGLLMTATTETFDVDNPAHLKAAQDMAPPWRRWTRCPGLRISEPWIAPDSGAKARERM